MHEVHTDLYCVVCKMSTAAPASSLPSTNTFQEFQRYFPKRYDDIMVAMAQALVSSGRTEEQARELVLSAFASDTCDPDLPYAECSEQPACATDTTSPVSILISANNMAATSLIPLIGMEKTMSPVTAGRSDTALPARSCIPPVEESSYPQKHFFLSSQQEDDANGYCTMSQDPRSKAVVIAKNFRKKSSHLNSEGENGGNKDILPTAEPSQSIVTSAGCKSLPDSTSPNNNKVFIVTGKYKLRLVSQEAAGVIHGAKTLVNAAETLGSLNPGTHSGGETKPNPDGKTVAASSLLSTETVENKSTMPRVSGSLNNGQAQELEVHPQALVVPVAGKKRPASAEPNTCLPNRKRRRGHQVGSSIASSGRFERIAFGASASYPDGQMPTTWTSEEDTIVVNGLEKYKDLTVRRRNASIREELGKNKKTAAQLRARIIKLRRNLNSQKKR